MRNPWLAGAAVLPLALLAACGTERAAGGGHWAGTIDTLANGAVLVQNPATGVWDSATAWRLEEDLRLGTAEGSGPELFGQIRDLEVDELGRIYVLDNQAKEIRVFGPDGAYVRTLGRQGAGPGEFENPNGMEWDPAGRLWVADPRNARYAVFDTAGRFLRVHQRPVGSWGYAWDGYFDRESYLYEGGHRPTGPRESEPVLLRMDSTANLVDTLSMPQYRPLTYSVRSERGGMVATVPFSPRLHWLVDGEGTLWFGTSDEYRIVRRSLQGDTLRVVEREYEPIPVSAEERDEALDSDFLREMRRRGGEVDPGKVPAHKPAYQGFVRDREGYLWVLTTPENEGETRLDVFDPEGRYLGQLRAGVPLDSYVAPVVRGDAIYGLARDEMDVPYVVRLRVRGRI